MRSAERRNERERWKWKNMERPAEINKVRGVGRNERNGGTHKMKDDK